MIARLRSALYRRLSTVTGLVGVLMKPRNGLPWSTEDRAFLRKGLREVASWTPALLLFLMPGSLIFLPLFAWVMDRRRGGRPTEKAS